MTNKRPLSEVQILNGTHDLKTKSGGVGFGAGSTVGVNSTAETIMITPAAAPVVTTVENAPEAAPAVTEEKLQEMLSAAMATVNNQITEIKQQSETESAAAIEEAKQAAEKQVAEAKAAADAEIERLKNELEEAKKGSDALAELGKLAGTNMNQQAQPLEVLGTGSQEMRNWQKMLDQAPGQLVMHSNQQFAQRDTRAARAYLKANEAAIRGGIEAELRDKGFLQGSGAIVTNAPTVIADIPSASFSYLADFIRRPSDTTLIYAQFARDYAVPGTAPRLQGQVPRYPYNPGPAAKADRTLTPGTDIGTSRQAVIETLVPVTIEELGLGNSATNAPLSLSHFVQAFSMQNLETIVQRNLGRDYQQTKDLFLRTELFTANTVVYNNGDRIVSAPGSVATGGIGRATRGFLRALFAYMSTQLIPTYSNGCYVLTLTPNQVQFLLSDMAAIQRFPEPTSTEIEMVSSVLAAQGSEDFGGVASGYRMTLDGFMIFQQNVHSTGAAGTPGVQSETLGAGARLTETCFAFGADPIAWATALPVEIRMDEVTNFGRRDSWIWYSHENSVILDVNEVGTAPNLTRERRVIQARFTRDPV